MPDIITSYKNYQNSLNNFQDIWISLRERLLKYPCVKTENNKNLFSILGNYKLNEYPGSAKTIEEYVSAIDNFILSFKYIFNVTKFNFLNSQNMQDIITNLNFVLTELTKEAQILSKYLSEKSFMEAMNNKSEASYCINLNDNILVVGKTGINITNNLLNLIKFYKEIATLQEIFYSNIFNNDIDDNKSLTKELKQFNENAKELDGLIDEKFNYINKTREQTLAIAEETKNNFDYARKIYNKSKEAQTGLDSLIKDNQSLSSRLQELGKIAITINNEITSMKQSHADVSTPG